MKKFIIKVIFFIISPFIISSFTKDSEISQLIFDLVLSLEFLLLSLYVLLKRDLIIDKLKGTNKEYKINRLKIPATIKKSYITSRLEYGDRDDIREGNYYTYTLNLDVLYYDKNNMEVNNVLSRIVECNYIDDAYMNGNVISVYIDPNDYYDATLFSISEYDNTYKVAKLWISVVSIIGIIGALHIAISSLW